MKCEALVGRWERGESLPVRGAWIEILRPITKLRKAAVSLPVRGAWIEINFTPAIFARW